MIGSKHLHWFFFLIYVAFHGFIRVFSKIYIFDHKQECDDDDSDDNDNMFIFV